MIKIIVIFYLIQGITVDGKRYIVQESYHKDTCEHALSQDGVIKELLGIQNLKAFERYEVSCTSLEEIDLAPEDVE